MFSLQDGRTALHHASSSGNTDMVKLLVDSGAQIDKKDKVSTEPCMALHRDSSLTISIFPHHSFTFSLPPTLVPVSPLSPVDLALLFFSLSMCLSFSPSLSYVSFSLPLCLCISLSYPPCLPSFFSSVSLSLSLSVSPSLSISLSPSQCVSLLFLILSTSLLFSLSSLPFCSPSLFLFLFPPLSPSFLLLLSLIYIIYIIISTVL